jgi:hypothetical protein
VKRLREWAEEDVRAIARDMPIMGIQVDAGDLEIWGDLMDEAADEIERLEKMVEHAVSKGVDTFPAECLPKVAAPVVLVDPTDGSEQLLYDPDLHKSTKQ